MAVGKVAVEGVTFDPDAAARTGGTLTRGRSESPRVPLSPKNISKLDGDSRMIIDMQQPRPYDIVGNQIQIAGMAGGAFEANFNYRITEGHDELTGNFMAGDGGGGHGQFQLTVDVSGAGFMLNRIFIQVFHASAKDGAELDSVFVPVVLGPKVVPGYTGYVEHTVVGGETLWGIAARYYGSGTFYYRLVAANPAIIINPNVIHPGEVIKVPRA
ncbi:LysM peptidoglycan-binding domain-containing protein [Nocardia tengchongensis]|nr:Gmad2 immunoglobulin-like domain-containing protein [Nocardia tengchongensis]